MPNWEEIVEVPFEIESNNPSEVGVWKAKVRLVGHTDSNWGADADGNRGMSADFVDGYEFLHLIDPDGNRVEYDKAPKRIKAEAEKAVERT